MATNPTTSSTTITFISETLEEGASIGVRLDEERNEGKSRFRYGTIAYFQVFKFPESLQVVAQASDGSVGLGGGGTVELTEQIIFANTDEASVQFPITSVVSTRWLGRSLGSVSAPGGSKIITPQSGVAVLEITYIATYILGQLSLGYKEEEEYPVVVFLLGE